MENPAMPGFFLESIPNLTPLILSARRNSPRASKRAAPRVGIRVAIDGVKQTTCY